MTKKISRGCQPPDIFRQLGKCDFPTRHQSLFPGRINRAELETKQMTEKPERQYADRLNLLERKNKTVEEKRLRYKKSVSEPEASGLATKGELPLRR
jgi:hypothetical protein